ncbi:MAG: OB-fold domain-containing protein [Chloroflexi bacterium]|nr:OB-fold domain-containing protein [Chloroflexota bacterium]
MAETVAAPEIRPLVPHLRIGATREEDYLFGSKCSTCGAMYAGPRLFCGKCSASGPFEEVKFGRDAEVHVFTIIHQATPYVKAPYVAAIVDLPEGVSINTNIEVDPKPENVKFGMKLKMYTEKASEDKEGNTYIAYRYRPA